MKGKITSQFWIGTFDTQERFNDFVCENKEYWSEENEIEENIPLSRFIASQGETWYDHDFFEAGYNEKEQRICKKFKGYSWVNQWAPIIEGKMKELGILEMNSFLMMVVDEPPDGKRYCQVQAPKSFNADGINLMSIGEITYGEK